MLELVDVGFSVADGNGEPVAILRNINLCFEPGKMYAITGPNGGGKTSLAKVIMGIYRPTEGRIIFDHRDITEDDVTTRARAGIGYAFQHPPRFKGLTVKDLLVIANNNGEREIGGFLRNVGLCPEDYVDREADASLSGGEYKRLEIAMLLARNPRVAIYDEPEAGVDLWTFDRLLRVIISEHDRLEDRITVVITHNEKFLRSADEIILVAGGEVKERGTSDEMMARLEGDLVCRFKGICGGELDAPECYR
ncbi:MAG: ATP-binding cassette domain-containing protein [Clostridia bacterium]|nr:ATP-binding cassette domain-containing protein [Clostridia bacterium]